ncbi:MAG: hypothetical protein AAB964_02220, partial [Patescibacteria group bacterium]
MKPSGDNCAYIDGANLHKGVEGLGWELDYNKFRVWLREKYAVNKAYLFLGLIPGYGQLYKYLQHSKLRTSLFPSFTYTIERTPLGVL